MDRRTFVSACTVASLAAPRATRAQPKVKLHRVALVAAASPISEMIGAVPVSASTRAFVDALRDRGFVEGRNLVLERRSAEGRIEQSSEIVAELLRSRIDVLATVGEPMARAARALTATVPIVMVTSTDPVREGLVQSLARPGGNVTGLTTAVGPESEAKRLDLLHTMLPGVVRVVYLASKDNDDWQGPWGRSLRTAAQTLGLTMLLVEFVARRYGEAFAKIQGAGAEALFVTAGPATYADRGLIVDFANRSRLPSTFAYREAVEVGGLMSYGVNLVDNFRRAGGYVARILEGAEPADLPVEQPTKFDLVINLKTAAVLGVTVPPSLVLGADTVLR